MGATYGLGIVDHLAECDASRDDKLAFVAAFARAAGCPVRDAFDGAAVEVTPEGDVTELEGDEAKALLAAVEDGGGSASYSSFRHLDGYSVCLDGAADEAEFELPDGQDGHVGPLAPLVERLDELLARDDVDEGPRLLHEDLRRLCDRAAVLRLPLTLGS